MRMFVNIIVRSLGFCCYLLLAGSFLASTVILLTFFKNTDRSLGHFRFKLSQTSRPRNSDVELNFASDYSQ